MQEIVLLPGLGCDQRLFWHQVKTLENKFKVNVIICHAFESMSNHIDFVLNNSTEKIVLIGHSFGGWVAQWVAIHAPERVYKLVLIGTGTGKLTPNLHGLFEKMFLNFKNNKKMEFFDKIRHMTVHEDRRYDINLLNIIRKMQLEFPDEGLINQVKTDLEGRETTTSLKKIKCDTLLLHGKQDLFYKDEMLVLKNNIVKNKYIEIDRCGHMVPLEKPAAVSELIDLWLG